LGFLRIEHVVDRVVERPEVRGYLFLEVARKESKGFSGLDRGTGEDDAVDHAFF
jgi:hypothetical protein